MSRTDLVGFQFRTPTLILFFILHFTFYIKKKPSEEGFPILFRPFAGITRIRFYGSFSAYVGKHPLNKNLEYIGTKTVPVFQ